jgi:tetratricopeptide (TPR) repeat protein
MTDSQGGAESAGGRAGDVTANARGAQLGQAAAAYRRGELEQAGRLCHELLEADRDDFEALLLLALIDHRAGRSDAAARHAERAVALDGGSPEAWATRGLILRALGRDAEALQSYAQALAIRPDFPDALYNRANLLRAAGRYEEALASYDRALAVNGEDPEALNNRGVVLQELERYQEALDSLARALRIRPAYPEALNNRGNALQALDFHERALECFDRAIALSPRYAEAFNNRGNALQALGRPQEALASYDAAIAIRPDYAEAFNNRGAVLLALGRHREALASCERALALRPGYAEALTHGGDALLAMNRPEDALACFERACALKPDFTRVLSLGNAQQALGRHEGALASYDKALSMRPDDVGALSNRGNALQALHRHREALQSYARAIELKPTDVQAHWNEALARLAIGDFERGWEQYEWRWQNLDPQLTQRYRERPVWLGREDIAGKTLLVYPEQGFGDAIQFVRYVPLVHARGARVVVACHRKLARLFRTVTGVETVLAPEQPVPPIDYCTALMSLPLALRTRLETIPAQVPYVSADPGEIAQWRQGVAGADDRLKVGFVWEGNPEFPASRAKACPLEQFASLFAVSGCAFFSVQTGNAATALQPYLASGQPVADLGVALDSFSDTAAAVCALDLVITIDTAVAHLAGALGKPVWILLPYAADWRWLLDREDSPWYPTARLFRQPAPGEWGGVMERVAKELAHLAAPTPARAAEAPATPRPPA